MEDKGERADFFLKSAIAIAGTVAMIGFAYLFHFVMVRMLPAADYGELGVIIGIFAILTVPVTNLQTILSREITLLNKEGRTEKIAFFVRKCLLVFSKPAVVCLALAFLLGAAVPALAPLAAIFAGAVFSYLIAIEGAYFQGMEKTAIASFIQAVFAALKLAAAVLLVYLGFGFFGAVFAIAIGGALTFALLYFPVTALGKEEKYEFKIGGEIWRVVLTSVFLTVFMYLDLFAVRLFLGAGEAGAYNVAAITARILYFLAVGMVVVLMPQSVKAGNWTGRLIPAGIASMMLIPAAVFFVAFAPQMMELFYGSGFLQAAQTFTVLSIAMLLFAVFFLLLNVFWSQREEKLPLLLSAGMIPLNALALFFLVPAFGIWGAALSTLIVSAIALLFALFLFAGKIRGDAHQQIPS